MNILHLLSQNHLTGAEVYAIQLIEQQVTNRHTVYQISNRFFMKGPAYQIPLEVETKSKFLFWKNVISLRKLLQEKNIHVIHTHSRAAAKLAFWARLSLPVGLVSTVHGRQHPSFSKKIMNQYGDFIISVCENIEKHLLTDFKYSQRRLAVVRNPISSQHFSFSKKVDILESALKSKKIKVGLIGRTTGPKGLRTQQILKALPPLFKQHGLEADYYLMGGEIKDLYLSENQKVEVIEVRSQLTSADYEKFDLVIGSGRVALESLITGIPTIAFGEAKYLGLAKLATLSDFFSSNFGDIDPLLKEPALNPDQLKKDLADFVANALPTAQRKKISEFLQRELNTQKISKRIFRFYESSYFLRNHSHWIPILMYHKIPTTELESKHKIFVTAANFKKHLQFYKSQGFKTVTFSDLKKFKSAQKSFTEFPKKPLLLTFDDGYKDNLDNASPLLEEFGFKAQLFLLANTNLNSNNWDISESEKAHEIVSGSDRKKWLTSAFEIGSHGFSHQRIAEMNEPQARTELHDSKISLEKEFQTEIPVFAFTYGDTTPQFGQMAFEEGYDYAVNTDSGGLLLEENPYQIFRVNIFPDETWFSLFKKTSSWYRRYYFRKRKK